MLASASPSLDSIEEAINLFPGNPDFRATKAAALVEQGKDPGIAKGEALYLEKRFERFPDQGEEWFLQTYLKSLEGRICEGCPNDPNGQKRLLAEYCANVLLFEEKYPSAFKDEVNKGTLTPELVDSCI